MDSNLENTIGSDEKLSGRFKSVSEDEGRQYSPEQMQALKKVADDLHRFNLSVTQAVDAGLKVELMRVSRYHNAEGRAWGDQTVPIIS
ncbi:MAG: hypothetical protein HQ503_00710 [Rhodospirillales bacterium]|nr:hypothetical protein [Rhodospirillales bacterium]